MPHYLAFQIHFLTPLATYRFLYLASPSTYNLQLTTFNLQPSTFYLLHSIFYLLPSTFYLLPSTTSRAFHFHFLSSSFPSSLWSPLSFYHAFNISTSFQLRVPHSRAVQIHFLTPSALPHSPSYLYLLPSTFHLLPPSIYDKFPTSSASLPSFPDPLSHSFSY